MSPIIYSFLWAQIMLRLSRWGRCCVHCTIAAAKSQIHRPKKTQQQLDTKTQCSPDSNCKVHRIYSAWHDYVHPVRPRSHDTQILVVSSTGHMAICLLGHEICLLHRGDTLSSFTSWGQNHKIRPSLKFNFKSGLLLKHKQAWKIKTVWMTSLRLILALFMGKIRLLTEEALIVDATVTF